MQILIDGDYARDRQGTGISTYARLLARALTALGHDIQWLSGASVSSTPDALADAAAISEQSQAPRGPRAWAQTAARMSAGLVSGKVLAREVLHRGVVVSAPTEMDSQSVHLAPELFTRAHYRHMLLRKFTDVRVSGKVDVLHLTAPLPISMSGVKRIVTIHDLIPIRLPYTTPDNRSEFVARVKRCARESDLVVTVSEASKADIVSLLDVDPEKVVVTYQASNLIPLNAEQLRRLPQGLSRFGLTPGGYLLCVGALEPKKNIKRLIEAFLEVDTPMPLVLAGPRGWMWESEVGAALAPLSDTARARVRFVGYLASEDLRRLYAGACVFLYPSLYEGFGLPALEAMISGAPVITSRTSSLPEVCGEAALYVDPFDRDEIRQRIEQALGDADLRMQLAKKGLERARNFSFEAYLDRLGSAYSRLSS